MAVHTKNETALKQYTGRWKDFEKEWKHLQNILKSAANESLGTIKRRSRRKYLKILDGQMKQLIEPRKNHIKMAEFKETLR